jgi:hypothetical protein
VYSRRFDEVNAALHDSLPRVDNVPAVVVAAMTELSGVFAGSTEHSLQQLADKVLYTSVVLTLVPPLDVSTTNSVGKSDDRSRAVTTMSAMKSH